jgi:hypothetical protein
MRKSLKGRLIGRVDLLILSCIRKNQLFDRDVVGVEFGVSTPKERIGSQLVRVVRITGSCLVVSDRAGALVDGDEIRSPYKFWVWRSKFNLWVRTID